MAAHKRCPACRSEVPAEARDCPHCPHTFVREEGYVPQKKFGMSSWPPVVWACVVLLAMIGAWRAIEFVIANADPDSKESTMQKFVDQRRIVVQDKYGVEKVISEGAPQEDENARQVGGETPTAPAQSLASTRLDTTSVKRAKPKAEDADEDDSVVVGPGAPPPPEVKEWRLRGMVYDLVTLQPVPHCAVYFTEPSSRARYETSTDGGGAYRTIVPALKGDAGYEVTFLKAGYAKSYLNPGTENVPQMAEQDRRQTAAELASTVSAPFAVQSAGAAPLVTDFYLAPTAP